jgi:NADPH:quinone reductase
MRAAVLVAHGAPPVVGDRPEPVQGPGTVLVEVRCATITPLDVLVASGRSYFGRPVLPYVPGVQGVGRVGERRVWFTTLAGIAPVDGSMAERAVVSEGALFDLPDGVEDTVVAALGLSAVAAARALERGGFREGERVLVLGAGGVVGQVAVQLARLRGAARVVAACRGATACARATRLGADAVVDVEGAGADAIAEDLRAAFPDGVDVVVDPVWGAPATAATRVLAPGGRLVNLGDAAGPETALSSAVLRSGSAEVRGYTNLSLSWPEQTSTLAAILEEVRAGRLHIDHDPVPLAEVTDGWSRQVSGTAAGRVVLTLD